MARTRMNSDKLVNYSRRLMQPRYWPQLRRLALRKLTSAGAGTTDARQATARCRAVAVNAKSAFAALGLARPRGTFAELFAERYQAARDRVDAAPGRMGRGADVDLIYGLCRAAGASRVLETGVAFGWSSLAILVAIHHRPGALLVSVDLPYLGANLDDQVGLAISQDLKLHWSLHRGADRERLAGALAEIRPLDLAHYDSDKSYDGRKWAYRLIWQELRPGGLLVSDDIGDNAAFLDFAEEMGLRALVVAAAHQDKFAGILRKPD